MTTNQTPTSTAARGVGAFLILLGLTGAVAGIALIYPPAAIVLGSLAVAFVGGAIIRGTQT